MCILTSQQPVAPPFLSALRPWSLSQDANSPEGFSSSWKIDCTTAVTSISADSYFTAGQKIEGQDLQHLKYGTSAAQSVTLSFWVKSSKTGTYMCELFQDDGPVKNSITYTVSQANTWENKSMTFVGNTGTAIANDNTSGLRVYWVLAAGSNRTSGTHSNNTWHTTTANRYPGIVNFADSTSNNLYIAGAQLEVGSVATDFEHRSYGQELSLCERYYEIVADVSQSAESAICYAGTCFSTKSDQVNWNYTFKVEKRAAFTLEATTGTDYYKAVNHSSSIADTAVGMTASYQPLNSVNGYITGSYSGSTEGKAWQFQLSHASAKIAVSAEL